MEFEVSERTWSETKETPVLGEETVLEEVTSRRRRSSQEKFRFPKTSHIPSLSPTKSRQRSDTRSRKAASQVYRVEDESYYYTYSTVTPKVRSSDSRSSSSCCSRSSNSSQKSDVSAAAKQPVLLDISCCSNADSYIDREFWAGFGMGFREANELRHCCTGGRDFVNCAGCTICLSSGDA
ncbi:hypothetical protein TWF481_012298 [Arthrobotrys musiformis]|uniref:Uncharacterized protein n=1 Tax=Arthrobotrys musiformis TaxID=47236 RepID=A0AAV9VWK3_9PEZI